jgi:hypothetical protein
MAILLPQAKERLGLPEAGRGNKNPSPPGFRGSKFMPVLGV